MELPSVSLFLLKLLTSLVGVNTPILSFVLNPESYCCCLDMLLMLLILPKLYPFGYESLSISFGISEMSLFCEVMGIVVVNVGVFIVVIGGCEL